MSRRAGPSMRKLAMQRAARAFSGQLAVPTSLGSSVGLVVPTRRRQSVLPSSKPPSLGGGGLSSTSNVRFRHVSVLRGAGPSRPSPGRPSPGSPSSIKARHASVFPGHGAAQRANRHSVKMSGQPSQGRQKLGSFSSGVGAPSTIGAVAGSSQRGVRNQVDVHMLADKAATNALYSFMSKHRGIDPEIARVRRLQLLRRVERVLYRGRTARRRHLVEFFLASQVVDSVGVLVDLVGWLVGKYTEICVSGGGADGEDSSIVIYGVGDDDDDDEEEGEVGGGGGGRQASSQHEVLILTRESVSMYIRLVLDSLLHVCSSPLGLSQVSTNETLVMLILNAFSPGGLIPQLSPFASKSIRSRVLRLLCIISMGEAEEGSGQVQEKKIGGKNTLVVSLAPSKRKTDDGGSGGVGSSVAAMRERIRKKKEEEAQKQQQQQQEEVVEVEEIWVDENGVELTPEEIAEIKREEAAETEGETTATPPSIDVSSPSSSDSSDDDSDYDDGVQDFAYSAGTIAVLQALPKSRFDAATVFKSTWARYDSDYVYAALVFFNSLAVAISFLDAIEDPQDWGLNVPRLLAKYSKKSLFQVVKNFLSGDAASLVRRLRMLAREKPDDERLQMQVKVFELVEVDLPGEEEEGDGEVVMIGGDDTDSDSEEDEDEGDGEIFVVVGDDDSPPSTPPRSRDPSPTRSRSPKRRKHLRSARRFSRKYLRAIREVTAILTDQNIRSCADRTVLALQALLGAHLPSDVTALAAEAVASMPEADLERQRQQEANRFESAMRQELGFEEEEEEEEPVITIVEDVVAPAHRPRRTIPKRQRKQPPVPSVIVEAPTPRIEVESEGEGEVNEKPDVDFGGDGDDDLMAPPPDDDDDDLMAPPPGDGDDDLMAPPGAAGGPGGGGRRRVRRDPSRIYLKVQEGAAETADSSDSAFAIHEQKMARARSLFKDFAQRIVPTFFTKKGRGAGGAGGAPKKRAPKAKRSFFKKPASIQGALLLQTKFRMDGVIIEQLADSIEYCNDAVVSRESMTNLMHVFPDEKEFKNMMLNQLSGLHEADSFFVELAKLVPHVEKKIRSYCLLNDLELGFDSIAESLDLFGAAVHKVASSPSFVEFLALLKATCDCLTLRPLKGLDLFSVFSEFTLKRQGKQSVLGMMIDYLDETDSLAVCDTVCDEFVEVLRNCRKVKFSAVRTAHAELKNEFASIQSDVDWLQERPQGTQFVQKMGPAVAAFKKLLDGLLPKLKGIEEAIELIKTSLGVDPELTVEGKFFQKLLSFLREVRGFVDEKKKDRMLKSALMRSAEATLQGMDEEKLDSGSILMRLIRQQAVASSPRVRKKRGSARVVVKATRRK